MGIFRFRKFYVCDDRATMKVGTDAVLLGAWTDVRGSKNILDIGSGSGVIALMAAQRTDEEARIDAVELLKDDAQQCLDNISHSPWPDKISVYHGSIQKFNSKTGYDCIICNPPFFSRSLLPPQESRRTARHDITLTRHELLEASVRLLSVQGRLNVILPYSESDRFISLANDLKLFPSRHTRFFSRPGKVQERTLLEFRFTKEIPEESSLVLYQTRDIWTENYRKLTEDFYLPR